MTSTMAPWEGLGGPVPVEDHRPLAARVIDPTLDSCCQREIEGNLRMSALKRTLQRHDVVAERERRRRHLVKAVGFDGCRCMYDPQTDGGNYAALLSLKSQRSIQASLVDGPNHSNDNDISQLLYCVEINAARPPPPSSTVEKEADEKKEEDDDDDDGDEFDYLLDEDLPGQNGELAQLEEQRRLELEMGMLQREIEVQHGYGTHRQMHPSRCLKAAGLSKSRHREPSPLVVVHLFDPESMASASLDLYLEELATTMRGTKFMRSNGRVTAQMEAALMQQSLPRFVANRDLPCLVAIKDGVVVNTCPRLQAFVDSSSTSGEDCFVVTDEVYRWLHQTGVLAERPPPLELLCGIRPEEEVLLDHLAKEAAAAKKGLVEAEFFHCGVPGCEKSFAHQHVGVQNEEQSGLVVSEQEIVGEQKEMP